MPSQQATWRTGVLSVKKATTTANPWRLCRISRPHGAGAEEEKRPSAGRQQPLSLRGAGLLPAHCTWDWRHPLAQTITAADGPMVICIDVRKVHPERVTASAEFWQGMILNGQGPERRYRQRRSRGGFDGT